MRNKSYIFGIFITLIGGVLWGFSGACGAYLFKFHQVSSDWLVPYRLLLSGILLLIFCLFKNPRTIFNPLKNIYNYPRLIFFALIGLMMTQYSYFYAIELSNPAVATVLQYTAPVFILGVACFYTKRLPSKIELYALILAIIGVFLLATHGKIDALVLPLKALIFCLISALCVVVYNFAPQKLAKIYGIELVLGWGLIIGGVVLALYMQVWNLDGVKNLSGYLALGGVVIFGTVLAFSFYLWGVELIGAPRASMIASIEPVSAAMFSYLWLGVEFVIYDFIGFIAIMLCVLILSKEKKDEFKC